MWTLAVLVLAGQAAQAPDPAYREVQDVWAECVAVEKAYRKDPALTGYRLPGSDLNQALIFGPGGGLRLTRTSADEAACHRWKLETRTCYRENGSLAFFLRKCDFLDNGPELRLYFDPTGRLFRMQVGREVVPEPAIPPGVSLWRTADDAVRALGGAAAVVVRERLAGRLTPAALEVAAVWASCKSLKEAPGFQRHIVEGNSEGKSYVDIEGGIVRVVYSSHPVFDTGLAVEARCYRRDGSLAMIRSFAAKDPPMATDPRLVSALIARLWHGTNRPQVLEEVAPDGTTIWNEDMYEVSIETRKWSHPGAAEYVKREFPGLNLAPR